MSCPAEIRDVLKDVAKMPICLHHFHSFRTVQLSPHRFFCTCSWIFMDIAHLMARPSIIVSFGFESIITWAQDFDVNVVILVMKFDHM